MNPVRERLQQFRQAMAEKALNACIIPGTDPHQSEYIAPHWKGRDWLSGFDGSAGTLVLTQDFGGLWTDSRYFIQAEKQLAGSGIELQKLKTPGKTEHLDWLIENLSAGDKVGIDTEMFSMSSYAAMEKLFTLHNIQLVATGDLFSTVWKDRPPLPQGEIFEHQPAFAGTTRRKKLTRIREEMEQQGVSRHLLTALDDIAWSLNLRGQDVQYNPVAICFALIDPEEVQLFIDPKKVAPDLAALLRKDGVRLSPYTEIRTSLQSLSSEDQLLLDPQLTNQALYEVIPEGVEVKKAGSIPSRLKAIKNQGELENLRHTMVKDGIALVHFFMWLEENLEKEKITEVSAGERLREFRARQSHFIGESFSTIAGYKEHGAIVHYRATAESDVALKPEGIFLLDSGGQFLDGTTDITRTIALGPPTEQAKRDFTLVLKGHIALSRAVFLRGTSGGQLDVLTRMPMWQEHINYGHGTGHGVGFFLNVHEGPQRIGQGLSPAFTTPLEPGMVTSNEPGIYREGEYGIRTENLILTIEDQKNDFGDFLAFENLTWFPIDLTLIEPSLMTQPEIDWLNQYHEEVYHKLAPYLEEHERMWLKQKTRKLEN